MATKEFEANLDAFVEAYVEDAEGRAKAARQFRDIVLRYPDLLEQAVQLFGDQRTASGAQRSRDLPRKRRMSPTEAIREWLRLNPDGGTSGAIVKGVIERVRTTSDKPASVVYSTVAVLKRKGEIVAIEQGKDQPAIYRLAERAENNGAAH